MNWIGQKYEFALATRGGKKAGFSYICHYNDKLAQSHEIIGKNL